MPHKSHAIMMGKGFELTSQAGTPSSTHTSLPNLKVAASFTCSMLLVRVVPRWYKDSVMGPSQTRINERSFGEGLLRRWTEYAAALEKEHFAK